MLECVRKGRVGFAQDGADDNGGVVGEEQGEDGKDHGIVDDGDEDDPTEEELQRLAEIRVRLPRDGTESSDLVFWVRNEGHLS